MKPLTQEWIKKAENDYLVVVRELDFDDPVYDPQKTKINIFLAF